MECDGAGDIPPKIETEKSPKKQRGTVFCWGLGKSYQLGNEKAENECVPRRVTCFPKGTSIVQVWGSSRNGALGNVIPTEKKVVKIACGNNLTAWIDEDGGLNACGIIGSMGTDGRAYSVPKFERNVTGVSLGCNFMLIMCGGEVYSWGEAPDCALGLGTHKTKVAVPTVLPQLTNQNVMQVSCSVGSHNCHAGAISDSGDLWMWGSGYKFKLGNGSDSIVPVPTKVQTESQVIQLQCGGIHSAVLFSPKGELFTFGCGSDGRLGHPIFAEGKYRYLYKEKKPKLVEALQGRRILDFSLGYYHGIALVQ